METGTGVNDNKKSSIKLFPNPTNDSLMLEFGESTEDLTIELFSASGKLAKSFPVSKISGNKYVLDLKNLPKGSYNLIVRNDKIMFSKTIIKF